MAALAHREALYRALRAALEDATGLPVDRNRFAAIDREEPLPRLVLQDGAINWDPSDGVEADLARHQATVEGYIEIPPGDEGMDAGTALGTALNDLLARTCQALFRPNALYQGGIQAGPVEIWALPIATDFSIAEVTQSGDRVAAFYLEFRFDVRLPHGDPFIEQP